MAIINAYETHPQLLARWHGAEDVKRKIIESFLFGRECYQVLSELESEKISTDEAAEQISKIIEGFRT